MSHVRVRFAPSPTGFLHVGGARTALFNWLFARHHGGVFVLRIEDTDAERSTEASTKAIYEGMEWLGLNWDEGPGVGGPHGPYVQTERKTIYHEEADRLLRDGVAYPCFCTSEELKERREAALAAGRPSGYDGRCRGLSVEDRAAKRAAGIPAAIRVRTPDGESAWDDAIKGHISFDNRNLEDFVILKSDGNPTYNFAVVLDDLRMEITHVIRGDDHVSNTPRQIVLYRHLDHALPVFAHVPMILGDDGTRLSKRHGATAVGAYREMGFVPEAMTNYLALLGWSLDGEHELFSREDLVRHFTLERCGSTPSTFDVQKLEWMNGVYLRDMPVERRTALVADHLRSTGHWPRAGKDEAWLTAVTAAVGDRLKRITDVSEVADFLFTADVEYTEEALEDLKSRKQVASVLAGIRDFVRSLEPYDTAAAEAALRSTAKEMGLKAGDLIHPLRVALSGKKTGPGIFDALILLGRDEALRRLERAESIVGDVRN